MFLRSQDKHGFVNLENVDTLCVSSEWEIVALNYNAKSFIGTYSTEEKALKVLDMIQEAYSRCESTRTLSSGTILELAKRFNQTQADDFKKEHRANFVFQMPQDSEV